jgi:hypothetical protein
MVSIIEAKKWSSRLVVWKCFASGPEEGILAMETGAYFCVGA